MSFRCLGRRPKEMEHWAAGCLGDPEVMGFGGLSPGFGLGVAVVISLFEMYCLLLAYSAKICDARNRCLYDVL